ncbi:hypothetical protein Ocepr_0415 [Oceanithermus profundus DSM 14977]|uniref:Uncharacterized protein n=1 Tax=Oceanithermus profundus (strain DSM 14977 / NBRC 100410 / VKM B-2274 / 506) TaxID=670487 RepID=E4U6T1_OCEP5|nr:hypothetical protein [Oceanithermus profundus]ADR35875.1 hypothetical protein Ocepr_0415 [Oceanithermus profundus DSM 14977]
MARNEVFLDTGALEVLHKLTEGEFTAPALADATGRALARIVRDLDRLERHGLVQVVGQKGEHKVYKATGRSASATVDTAKHLLEHLKTGVDKIARGKAEGTMSAVFFRTTEERAKEVFELIRQLRERLAALEAEEEPETGPLVTVFFGGWKE